MPQPNREPQPDLNGAATARADRLITLFFEDRRLFGQVEEVGPEEVPEPYRRLLDHRSHMTVTMEAFVGGQVSLRVLGERRESKTATAQRPGLYSREIKLISPSGKVVQYGIVSVDLAAVPPVARERILAGSSPLGRVLIEAGTLRDVHDVSLVRMNAGAELARRMGVEPGRTLYGRVAAITLAPQKGLTTPSTGSIDSAVSVHSTQVARQAVELLEIPVVE